MTTDNYVIEITKDFISLVKLKGNWEELDLNKTQSLNTLYSVRLYEYFKSMKTFKQSWDKNIESMNSILLTDHEYISKQEEIIIRSEKIILEKTEMILEHTITKAPKMFKFKVYDKSSLPQKEAIRKNIESKSTSEKDLKIINKVLEIHKQRLSS